MAKSKARFSTTRGGGHLTSKGKWIIVLKRQEGMSATQIHKQYGFDMKTIRLWENRALPHGEVEIPDKVSVSPVRTRELVSKIKVIRKKELRKGRGYNFTAPKTLALLNQDGVVVSATTVAKVIRENLNLVWRSKTKTMILTDAQRARRVKFCRLRYPDGMVWTDETMINTLSRRKKGYVPKDKTLRAAEPRECHEKGMTGYPEKQMFWAAISEVYENLRSPLYAHPANVDADSYIHCLKTTLLKNMPGGTQRGEWVFMQDSCTHGCHSSKKVRDALDAMGVQYLGDKWPMTWPANSPDLNPIEGMWKILKDRVAARCPTTKAELIKYACEEWDLIPNDMVQKLLDRADKLRKECAKNGGYKVGK